MTHPDVVTGHESHLGHAKLGHACRCSLTCQWLLSHSHTVVPTTSDSVTEYEVCVSVLQNVINKYLHHILFSPSPPLFFSCLFCPISCFTNSLCIYISYIFCVLSFLSFPSLLHFLPHFSQFSLLPGLHASKEDKVVSIFFVFSLCCECDVCAT